MASRARLALHVAGALAGRAGLVKVERERPVRAAEGFLERDLDARLHVLTATGPARREQVLRVEARAAPAEIAEHRAEELGEVPEDAAIGAVLARGPGGRAGPGLG